ncbi:MAG: hypothetical protein JW881_03675 [Spirochaetales bacterium]|nr:hypothetical protein [Spirochaetales bacterium]
MNKGIFFFLFIFIPVLLSLTGCDIFPPECYLQAEVVSWYLDGSNYVVIQYRLTNVGSVDLENCQVKFGIDDVLSGGNTVSYDYITATWWPSGGIYLNTGESSGTRTCNTGWNTGGAVPEYVGVYAIGFDNPPDED